MLRSVALENFKAFGSATKIDLAPITLFFGENSAGKSSILQALTLLKQTHESRESGAPLLPRAEDGIVDLGSFTELLFDHDVGRVLRLGLVAQTKEQGHMPPYIASVFRQGSCLPMGLGLTFSRNERTSEVGLSEVSVELPKINESFARFRVRALDKSEYRKFARYSWAPVHRRHMGRQGRLLAGECIWISEDPLIWQPIYKAWHDKRGKVVEAISRDRKALSDETVRRQAQLFLEEVVEENSERDLFRALEEAVTFYSSDFNHEQFVKRMVFGYKSTQIAIDGFIPSLARLPVNPLPELRILDPRRGGRLNLPRIDVTEVAFATGRIAEDALDSLFPMGPFRRPPERWYIFTGTSPADVGYRGDHLPDLLFRRPELVRDANQWLEKLEIGYKLRVRPIGERYSDLFEVRLVDTRRHQEVDVALSDVGFGISQILPFIVQSLASQQRIISIEQPEVHIHPRLQADLGNLIAETIREPYSHQFLIETHSEHLILRLQRLIRDKQLDAENVSVIFVSRGPNGSIAQRLYLDENGDFVDDWPGGFFPERLRELR